MTSVSNISIGANIAGAAASKARHGMNEAIARLSTGKRSMYGGDAAGQATAHQLKARGMSYAQAARNTEDGISVAQTIESALMEIAALGQRLRELGVQAENSDIHSTTDVTASTAEVTAITATIDNIVAQTLFNGVTLMATGATTTINIGTTDTTSNDFGISSTQIAATSGTTTAAASSSRPPRDARGACLPMASASASAASRDTVLPSRRGLQRAVTAIRRRAPPHSRRPRARAMRPLRGSRK